MAVGSKVYYTKIANISNDFLTDGNKIRKGSPVLIHYVEQQMVGAKSTRKGSKARDEAVEENRLVFNRMATRSHHAGFQARE